MMLKLYALKHKWTSLLMVSIMRREFMPQQMTVQRSSSTEDYGGAFSQFLRNGPTAAGSAFNHIA